MIAGFLPVFMLILFQEIIHSVSSKKMLQDTAITWSKETLM